MKKIGLFFLLFSLAFLILMVPKIGVNELAVDILGEDFNTDEAKLFPYMIGIIILVISVVSLLQGWLAKPKVQENTIKPIDYKKLKEVGILLLISVLYVLLLEPLGFFIMTPIALFVCLWFFGSRKWLGLTVMPIIVTMLIFLCFEELMSIQLPKGILEWMFY